MSKKELFQSLFLLLVVMGLIFGYQHLQWKDVEKDLGYSKSARANPYLAAEKFLQAKQVSVTVHQGLRQLDQLPPLDTVLILSSAHRSLSQRRINNLLEWVRAGGRLITSVPHPYNDVLGISGDRLLDPLNIYLVSAEQDLLQEAESLVNTDSNSDVGTGTVLKDGGQEIEAGPQLQSEPLSQCGSEATAIFFDDDQYETWVNVGSAYDIHYEGDDASVLGAVAGDVGYRFLQVAVGEGIITVFPNLNFWLNRSIDQHDHAHLLYQLTGNKVWILYDRKVPSIVALIAKFAPYLVVTVVIFLILLFWRNASRFGGIIDDTEKPRRQLLEHISACASLAWKKGRTEYLLQPMQREIEELLQKDHPGSDIFENNSSKINHSEQRSDAVRYVAQEINIQIEEINSLLTTQQVKNEFDLVEKIQMLQKIRNAL